MHPHQIWRPLVSMAVLVAATLFATTTVVVEPGDTLSEIAARHDVTIAELVEWNDLDDPDRIIAGATLIVAAPDDTDRPAVAVSSGEVHVVTAGDTLSGIAHRLGVAIADLVAANGLDDPDRIIVGQSLRLTAPPPVTTTTRPAQTHTVVAGDTLGLIAARYGVSVRSLAERNGIDDVDLITIGDRLVIDGDGTPEPSTTTVPPPTTTAAPTPESDEPPPATTTTTPPTPTEGSADRDAGDVLLVPLFAEWADVYDVPQDLLEAIAWKESSWRPDAVGPGGHLGLMQFSPDTVDLIEGGLLGREVDPMDAQDAIQMGARFLRFLLDRTDGEREATAAWAQGLTSVQRDGVTTAGAAYADSVEEIRQQRR